MAVTKITYENKKAIQNDVSVARKNKVIDEDMNEIKQVVNNNADEVTTMQETIEDLQEGQGTSDTDITNLKNRVTTLEEDNTENKSNISLLQEQFSNFENYDDTEIKEDISEIKQEQQTQNSDIENLQTNDVKQDSLISKLKNATLNAETEESKSIHVEDASTIGQLEVLGNQEQDGEPSPENEVPVICLGSNKNEFNGSDTYNGYILGTVGQKISYQSTALSKTYKSCCKLLKDKTYIISFNKNNPANTSAKNCVIADEDENILQTFGLIPTEETLTITPTQTGYLYLVMDINATNIKIEEGTQATSYSPYNQGSVLISKVNKNFYDKDNIQFYNNNSSLFENTSNNNNARLRTNSFVLKEGSYIISEIPDNVNLLDVRAYNSEKEYIEGGVTLSNKNFTLKQGIEYIHLLFNHPNNSDISANEFSNANVMIEKGSTATEYVEHQQTDYLLYIQQEMLQGDYFVKEADGWKEVHSYSKKIFNGTEAWNLESLSQGSIFYTNIPDALGDTTVPVYSNCFMYYNGLLDKNYSCRISGSKNLNLRCNEKNTAEEFKQMLADKYNAGNPVYAFYKSAIPSKLACTPEQSAVLEELNNLDLFEGVNNIITTEDIALLKLKYALDIKTYVDNQLANVNAQILNIAGGN